MVFWLDRRRDNDVGPELSDFGVFISSFYFGDRFTDRDVDAALTYLEGHGLIGRQASEQEPRQKVTLTASGIECASAYDYDVAAFLRSREHSGARPTNQYNLTVLGGQGVIVGPGGQVVQKFGADVQDLLPLIAELHNLLAVHEGDDPSRMRLLVHTIESELADDEPSPEVVRATTQKLGAVAGRFGNAAVTAAVSTFFTALSRHYGWV